MKRVNKMKRVLKISALICAMIMLLGTMCGCSAFIEGFMEGYNEAMQEAMGQDEFSADDYSDDASEPVFFTPEEAAELFSEREENCDSDSILGMWIDSEDDVLEFFSDDSVNWFDLESYDSYNFDGKFLCLYRNGEETKHLARLFDDMLVIYGDSYYYERVGEGSGLFGRWDCVSHDDGDYSFDFRNDGTFNEDGAYNGIYYIDGNDILLSYDDSTAELCIFVLDGDKLAVAYGHVLYYTPHSDELEDTQ